MMVSVLKRRGYLRVRTGLRLGVLLMIACVSFGCMAAPARFAPIAIEPAATPTAPARHDTAAGVPITRTFRVMDQTGGAVMGAGVYVDGVCAGVTDARGTLEYAARDGAAVVATRLVGWKEAVRRNPAAAPLPPAAHASCSGIAASCAGFGCAYQALQTSLVWRAPDAAGAQGAVEPHGLTLPAAAAEITLTIGAARPLILFNLLVSVEWDAQPDYLADLAAGLRAASRYIWDYTDGQMALGQVAILDDRAGWAAADIQVRASNEICPQANIGGMVRRTNSARPAITLGPYWTQSNGADPAGRWSLPTGYQTIGHEFAHYALGLYDQYVNANHKDGVWCTAQFPRPDAAATNASVMDRQYATSELDDKRYNWTPDCERTWQYAISGESAWATISQRPWAGARLVTPSDQGGVNPGPTVWPPALPPWPVVTGDAAPVEAIPITLRVDSGGSYDAYLMQCHRGQTASLGLGRVNGGERFAVLGARPGDLIWVSDRRDATRFGAARAPESASGAMDVTIEPCVRSRPVSCADAFPDGVCAPATLPAPAPPVSADGISAGAEPRSLSQHGYRRAPERDTYPNTLESADGLFRLHLDTPTRSNIIIIEQPVSEEIRRLLREFVPVSKLYRVDAESRAGFSINAQLQSVCPPRSAPSPPTLFRVESAAGSRGEPRLIPVEQARWFPQEGYILTPLLAPGAYLLAARP